METKLNAFADGLGVLSEQVVFGQCQCGAYGQLFARGCAHCHIAALERENERYSAQCKWLEAQIPPPDVSVDAQDRIASK